MAYTKHEFKSGEKLYAFELNEMEEQIAANEAANNENKEQIEQLSKEIDALTNEFGGLGSVELVELTDWVKVSYCYDTSGDTVDLNGDTNKITNSMFYHQKVQYRSGEKYHITGKGGGSPRLWSFVASDGAVLLKADKDAFVTDYVVTCDHDCTLLVQVMKSFDYALYKEVASGASGLLAKMRASIENIEKTDYVFGAGINCDYATPEIPKFTDPGADARIDYFYGLYDELVAAYPDYVSKIDCDAEMAAAGIAKPNNLGAYPMYMYKFEPALTSGASDLTTETASKPVKLFVTTGTHGELIAVYDTYHTMRLICEEWQNDANLEALRWECAIYIIPCSGLYPVDTSGRTNINGVDLNRNCPTSKWAVKGNVGDNTYTGAAAGSEYETKVFMHYLKTIDPHVYIDHHNSSNSLSNCCFYGEAMEQILINIAANVISSRSRKLRMRLEGVFPECDWTINGFTRQPVDEGTRCQYAYEQGYHSITFETNSALFYENGVNVPTGAGKAGAVACRIAVDGFLNFVLLALKELAKRPYVLVD